MADHIMIPTQGVRWQQDYYSDTSVDFDPDTHQAVIDQRLTNTFKLGPLTAGAKVLFYGADKKVLGSAQNHLFCYQAPLVGAAHASQTWHTVAPNGTQAIALVQYWQPTGLDQLALDFTNFLNDPASLFDDLDHAIDKWCEHNPTACKAIGISLLVIAGTSLCAAFPAECSVVIPLGAIFEATKTSH